MHPVNRLRLAVLRYRVQQGRRWWILPVLTVLDRLARGVARV